MTTRQTRELLGMTQKQFAPLLGMRQPHVARRETRHGVKGETKQHLAHLEAIELIHGLKKLDLLLDRLEKLYNEGNEK